MATLTASAGSPAGALQGQWGGDQLRLVIDAQGGRIATACADGSFRGPLMLAADSSFLVTGVYDQHQPGPQRADEDAAHASARFSGGCSRGSSRKSGSSSVSQRSGRSWSRGRIAGILRRMRSAG